MKPKYQVLHSSKNRRVIVNTKTGAVKEVILDQKERESIKQGVHLQPAGKDEKRFFDTYKQVKKLPTGEVINVAEHNRLKREHTAEQKTEEKDNWDKERIVRFDKFGSVKKWH